MLEGQCRVLALNRDHGCVAGATATTISSRFQSRIHARRTQPRCLPAHRSPTRDCHAKHTQPNKPPQHRTRPHAACAIAQPRVDLARRVHPAPRPDHPQLGLRRHGRAERQAPRHLPSHREQVALSLPSGRRGGPLRPTATRRAPHDLLGQDRRGPPAASNSAASRQTSLDDAHARAAHRAQPIDGGSHITQPRKARESRPPVTQHPRQSRHGVNPAASPLPTPATTLTSAGWGRGRRSSRPRPPPLGAARSARAGRRHRDRPRSSPWRSQTTPRGCCRRSDR